MTFEMLSYEKFEALQPDGSRFITFVVVYTDGWFGRTFHNSILHEGGYLANEPYPIGNFTKRKFYNLLEADQEEVLKRVKADTNWMLDLVVTGKKAG